MDEQIRESGDIANGNTIKGKQEEKIVEVQELEIGDENNEVQSDQHYVSTPQS